MIVTDNGVGIPAEFLPWVFEPFQQADASTTRPYGGLGLGLSIVKHLVEAHGGSVSVASAGEGRGSTFTVRLPIMAMSGSEQVPPWRGTSDRRRRHGLLEGIRVLVVDDDRENREVVAANLASRQATVLTADSAAQALEVLQRERIDVLLADIAMPGEDGYSLIRKRVPRRWNATAADPCGRPDRAGPRRRSPAGTRRRLPAAPGEADRIRD